MYVIVCVVSVSVLKQTKTSNVTILNPHVQLLGEEAASIAYIRVIQSIDKYALSHWLIFSPESSSRSPIGGFILYSEQLALSHWLIFSPRKVAALPLPDSFCITNS